MAGENRKLKEAIGCAAGGFIAAFTANKAFATGSILLAWLQVAVCILSATYSGILMREWWIDRNG